MAELAVSIVTWNHADTISNCIDSVLLQSYTNYVLYVVDNNSSDSTIKVIEQFKDERLHLIKGKENTGFCGGHNQVINQTTTPFIILVNPDVILKPDYFKNAVEMIKQKDEAGTICGLLLQEENTDNGSKIDSTGLDFSGGRMALRNHGKKIREVVLRTEEVFGSDGALPLYRRNMIDDIKINGNFFDPMFFAHKEDWDVSWRSQLFGWKTFFHPACIAIHPRSFKPKNLKVRQGMSDIVKYHAVKNQLLLYYKNATPLFLLKNFFKIVPRQLSIFLYILFFERKSLKAYSFIFKNHKQLSEIRKIIQRKTIK